MTEPRKRGLGRGKGRLTDSPDGRGKVAVSVRIPPDVADMLDAACKKRGDRSRIVGDALRAFLDKATVDQCAPDERRVVLQRLRDETGDQSLHVRAYAGIGGRPRGAFAWTICSATRGAMLRNSKRKPVFFDSEACALDAGAAELEGVSRVVPPRLR